MYILKAVAAVNPNKHQLKTEATRRKLLSAALHVFTRDGFERSSLEDIASEAGHSRGAFYANFETKEDLFIALLEQQASKRVAGLARALDPQPDEESRLRAMRDHYVSKAKDRQWSLLTLEFKLYALRNAKHRTQLAAAHQRIRDSFQMEVANRFGLFGRENEQKRNQTRVLLEVIWSGLVLENAYDPKRVSSEEVTELLGEMFELLGVNRLR